MAFGNDKAQNRGTLLPVFRAGGDLPLLAPLAPQVDARYAALPMLGMH